jgi:hypothetical protein
LRAALETAMSTANVVNRRQFLGRLGVGIGGSALALALADRLGFADALAAIPVDRLKFGTLDPLVDLMQETAADALMPLLVTKLRTGTSLSDLVGAAALANARALGGTDYNGYHALMAMVPSFEMSAQMPLPYAALPVLKVVHRSSRFVKDAGRSRDDALSPLDSPAGAARLVESVRLRDLPQAEQNLAALVARSKGEAYEQLQTVVRDDANVHRVVLAWRAYDVLRFTGEQNALTMLRQSVRFCIDEDGRRAQRGQQLSEIGALVPRLMDEHGLDGRAPGTRAMDENWIAQLSDTFFGADGKTAAEAAAAALAEGTDPENVGAAMSLAATRLLLHDPGRTDESPGKPRGSMHGASVGVHASDSANAWRHIARVSTAPTSFASLIAGAYHTAGQSRLVGAQPFDHDGEACTKSDPAELLREIEGRIRDRDQRGACLAARRYCELGHGQPDLFALLLRFAVSEDGALHSEKYFRTAQDEHGAARPAHRALYLIALTRVMASSFGFPAPGCEEATKLLSA